MTIMFSEASVKSKLRQRGGKTQAREVNSRLSYRWEGGKEVSSSLEEV